MFLVDAHNHLQDERLISVVNAIVAECQRIGVRRAVVNGTHPRDWGRVSDLAAQYDWILPSFGVHPWYVEDLAPEYLSILEQYLDARPSVIGEIGIDYWKEGCDRARQEEVFLAQLRIARERELPVTIHGLKAWGRLYEILHSYGVSSRGFLLHSYSGPLELVEQFADLGAYFSVAPWFFSPRRARQLEVFRRVPLERILPETDAPDQAPPIARDLYYPFAPCGKEINHPGNIEMVYAGLTELCGIGREELEVRLKDNFARLFGDVVM